ncbi:FHA domain-containing protein, partial [Myxococcota bacterium]|nr:FHA domain-containing protein [Myxococcota bacterium]
ADPPMSASNRTQGPRVDQKAAKAELESSGTGRGAWVVVQEGFYAGLEMPLQTEGLVIGRGREADLVLAESTISRSHARIDPGEDEGWLVEDLGSTNGPRVNGVQVSRQRVTDGDEIRMGRLVLGIRLA